MKPRRPARTLALACAAILTAACGSKDSARSDVVRTPASSEPATVQTSNGALVDTQTSPQHHSKVKGAIVGAMAGGLIAGKRGVVAGATAGAEMQHQRNKNEEQKKPH